MYEIYTAIDIDAPVPVVWDVLTDFEAYEAWNPWTRVTGEPTAGARLTVAPGPEAKGVPTFRPRVLVADGTELRWLGHLYVRGLFDGDHRFAVESRGDGQSRLVQSERFGGLLAGPLFRRYGASTEERFEAVNAALKGRAEGLAGAGAA